MICFPSGLICQEAFHMHSFSFYTTSCPLSLVREGDRDSNEWKLSEMHIYEPTCERIGCHKASECTDETLADATRR